MPIHSHVLSYVTGLEFFRSRTTLHITYENDNFEKYLSCKGRSFDEHLARKYRGANKSKKSDKDLNLVRFFQDFWDF